MPRVSIIIPVHNVESYLRECLDAVVGQTLRDIEIICVDDNSDDASPEILREYGKRDQRLRVITFSENGTASQARKDAVLASTGEYIMFLDADDTIELDACERLYSIVQHDPVDILHFGTTILNDAHLPPDRIERMRRFVRPYDGVLDGTRILEGAFSTDPLYNFTLWDKLYSAELCKKGFSRIKDGRFPKAQDKYAYFVLSYYARTYRGVPNTPLYTYHFGRGVTGHHLLTLTHFEKYCGMALVADAIRDFLVEEGAIDQHRVLYDRVREQLLTDCVANWNSHLRESDKAAGFDLMLDYWEASEVVAKIAQLNWENPGHVARSLRESSALTRKPRESRTIGTYYHRYANGGVQRVLSILIQLWTGMGYRVVLFTDLPPSPEDYELPDGVERVVLPSVFDVDSGTYIERAREIARTALEYEIDAMVYHAWVSPVLIWDLLIYKATGVAFVSHCHSVFSQPLRSVRKHFADLPAIYGLCDTIITLSEVDELYWSNFNSSVVCTANPLPFDLNDIELSDLGEKNVLWLGRVSREKRPHEAIEIFERVLESEPDAKLLMVGGAPQQEYMDSVHARVENLGMQDSVVFYGFQNDVQQFYSRAAVMLITSEFEGYSMTLSESQSAGVPCVMYDLPYLTLTRQNRGFVSVEQGDINAAADAVVDLLRDHDYRRSLGCDARANIEGVASSDFAVLWREVFGRLSQPVVETPTDETTVIMWETLLDHYRSGAASKDREIRRLKVKLARARIEAKRGSKVQKQLQRVRGSRSYRAGRALTFLPRKLRGLVSRRWSGLD